MSQTNPPVQINFTALPVYGATVPVTGTGPMVAAGRTSQAVETPLLVAADGSVFITGSLTVAVPPVQNVTGSVAVTNQVPVVVSGVAKTWDPGTQSVSGSVSVYTQGPQAVSGSVTVTGSVGISAPVAMVPFRLVRSSALASYLLLSAVPCVLGSVSVEVDATAPSSTYYLALFDASALPAPGTATQGPIRIDHVSGSPSRVSVSDDVGLTMGTGSVVALSTTQWTLATSSAYLNVVGASVRVPS